MTTTEAPRPSRLSSLPRKAIKAAMLPMGMMRPRRTGDVVILLYHRVGEGNREIDLPVDLFEEHLRILRRKDRILSLDAALSDEAGGVVLTFDDGYRDFDEHVVPLLVQYRVPALLYLATGLVAQENGASDDALTWTQLQRAVATGLVTVGAHTHTHANLADATEEEATLEMRTSRELVERHLGFPCRHFAYPWSVASEGARRAADRLFDTSALDSWKTNRRGAIDPQRLGRIPILRSDGTTFFRAKTLGLLDTEALAYRLARRGPWRSSGDLVAPQARSEP